MVAVGVLTVAAGFGWFAGMVGCLDFGVELLCLDWFCTWLDICWAVVALLTVGFWFIVVLIVLGIGGMGLMFVVMILFCFILLGLVILVVYGLFVFDFGFLFG